MKIYVDLDNTLLISRLPDYDIVTSIQNRIQHINALYEKGHEIVIYTARGSATGKDWKEKTEEQLKQYGIHYHRLDIGNKPDYDLLIDDKAISAETLDLLPLP